MGAVVEDSAIVELEPPWKRLLSSLDEDAESQGLLQDSLFTEDRLLSAFRLFDKDGDGALDHEEFKRALGGAISDEDVSMIMADFDANGDGVLQYDEMAEAWAALEMGEPGTGLGDAERAAFDACFGNLCIGGCVVVGAENRAITIDQLTVVHAHMCGRCDELTSSFTGKQLTEDGYNLYDANTHAILPATRPRQCSLVELVARGTQPPDFFVSHWWGEAVFCFLACLRKHELDRNLRQASRGSEGTYVPAYWVCAYANNQHQLAEAVTADPRETSFFKALQVARGAVSLVDDAATCFSRIWCGFEVYEALAAAPRDDFLYDVYTHRNHTREYWTLDGSDMYDEKVFEAVGLVDGFADSGGDDVGFKEDARDKGLREGFFPLGIIRKGAATELQCGQASMEVDRKHILNVIAERMADLEATPPDQCAQYDKVNAILRGRMAASVLERALDPVGEGARADEAALHLDEFLAAFDDSDLKKLSVHERMTCSFWEQLRAKLPCLTELNFTSCAGLEAVRGILELPALKRLNLSESMLSLEGARDLGQEISKHPALQRLDLAHCELPSSSLRGIVYGLCFSPMLKTVNLMGSNVTDTDTMEDLGGVLKQNKTLASLSLSINFTPGLIYLFQGVAENPDSALQSLDLTCASLGEEDAAAMEWMLDKSPSLKSLSLCALETANEAADLQMADALERSRTLEELNLNNMNTQDVDGRGFGHCWSAEAEARLLQDPRVKNLRSADDD